MHLYFFSVSQSNLTVFLLLCILCSYLSIYLSLSLCISVIHISVSSSSLFLSINLSIYLSIHQSLYISIYLYIFLSINLSIHHLDIYWFGFQIGGKCSLSTAQLSGGWKLISIYFFKSSSVLIICCLGVDLYLITFPSIHLSIYLSIYLSILSATDFSSR